MIPQLVSSFLLKKRAKTVNFFMTLIGNIGPLIYLSCWMTAMGSDSRLPLACIPPSLEPDTLETLSGFCYSTRTWSYSSEVNVTYNKTLEENQYQDLIKVDSAIDVGHGR